MNNKFEASNCPICGQPYCEHVKPATGAAAAQEQVVVEPEKTDENESKIEVADIYEVNENMPDQEIASRIVDTVIESTQEYKPDDLDQKYKPIKILLEYEKTVPEAIDKMNIREAIKSQLATSVGIRRKGTDFNTMVKGLAYYAQQRLEKSVAENKDKLTNYIGKRNPEKQKI